MPDRDGSRAEQAARFAAASLVPDSGTDITRATTVAELWTAYRAHLVKKGRAPGTLRQYDRWATDLIAEYGLRRIGPEEFGTSTAEAYLERVADKHGRGSMLNARSLMSGMFRFAVRKNAFEVNPVREAEVPEDVQPKGRIGGAGDIEIDDLCFILASVYWSTVPCPRILAKAERTRAARSYTPPTVAAYCDSADLADFIAISAAIGQRPSQVLGLAWPDYDRERRTVRTVGKIVRVKGKGLVRVVKEGDRKNPQGTIALPEFAVKILDRRWQRMHLRKKQDPPPVGYEVDLIFPSFEWTARDPVNVNHQWQRVRQALGLPDDITPYTFRKFIALTLDDAKMSARVTADVLQHADPAMTQRRYMRRGKVHHEAAAVINDAVLGGLRARLEAGADGDGRSATLRRLFYESEGSGTNPAPDL
ncbi:tyrosine recombinase XerC [Nocardia africana]|uniref:Tyrosine recombinase XerC n=1 Tax=Nocardia africana TaxID=134964 RepID=A0ABW6NT78_9NOCA